MPCCVRFYQYSRFHSIRQAIYGDLSSSNRLPSAGLACRVLQKSFSLSGEGLYGGLMTCTEESPMHAHGRDAKPQASIPDPTC
eukprot:s2504_g5.t1